MTQLDARASVVWPGRSLPLGCPTLHVMIVCVILFGIGLLSAVTHTRAKDRPQ